MIAAILHLGNLKLDEKTLDTQKNMPCSFENVKVLEKVSQLLLQFRHQALDVSLVLDKLISTLHELAILQYLPDLSLKYSDEINRKIMQLSKLISAQDLQLYYQIACKGRSDLQLAVTQEQGFEMCILRLLAFRPLAPNEILVSELEHHANLIPWQELCEKIGTKLKWIPITDDGILDYSKVESLINKKTKKLTNQDGT